MEEEGSLDRSMVSLGEIKNAGMDVCVCNRITLLYTRNYHNIVNLYSSIKLKKKECRMWRNTFWEEETFAFQNDNLEVYFTKQRKILCYPNTEFCDGHIGLVFGKW